MKPEITIEQKVKCIYSFCTAPSVRTHIVLISYLAVFNEEPDEITGEQIDEENKQSDVIDSCSKTSAKQSSGGSFVLATGQNAV